MKIAVCRLCTVLALSLYALICNAASFENSITEPESLAGKGNVATLEGIVFRCRGADLTTLADSLTQYFKSLGVPASAYTQRMDVPNETLQFLRVDQRHGTDTLSLIHQVDADLREELIQLPRAGNTPRTVVTVSKKEILLALLQSGRTTQFNGEACTSQALQDQVGIRQNIVAWSESIEFKWPDGGAAHWNAKYWNHGNLKSHRTLHAAINDAFMHPKMYTIGCYTATKLIVIQGVLDFYRRIKKDVVTTQAIEARLMLDGDPLTHIEPGAAWSFEKESTREDLSQMGKLVSLTPGVASDNFVPGDWVYFVNTDPVTYEKTGYEGSNAIYLGRGLFDDYYNDNNHNYTYKDKLLEVYQWRHKVFSRERDVAKIHPLSAAEIETLGHTPERGGLELDYRLSPYLFGFAKLPTVVAAAKLK